MWRLPAQLVGSTPVSEAALWTAGKTREQAADRVAQLDRQRARKKELEAGAPKKRDRKPKAFYEDRKAVSCLFDKGWKGSVSWAGCDFEGGAGSPCPKPDKMPKQ